MPKEAFSILDIPLYIRKKLKKTYIGSNTDYARFNIRSNDTLANLKTKFYHLFYRANDTDNSDIVYDGDLAVHRVRSPNGVAHNVIMSIEGGKPIAPIFIEIYHNGKGLKGSVWRVDFKWSFFHFYEQIPDRWKAIYIELKKLSIEWVKVRKTRSDIAFDFAFPFPQNGENWIQPDKNSKREVQCYRHEGLWNSFWYLAEKNSAYGVRIYNKKIDIAKNKKEFWYGGEEKLPEHWTRIEFEFYPPYSLAPDEEMMRNVAMRIMGVESISLGLPFRPCLEFNIERAYTYISRYAKNHGITMERLVDELVAYQIHIENMREYHSIPENIWLDPEKW